MQTLNFDSWSKETKAGLVKSMIFPIVLYGCETWTKTKALEDKIDACEMWIWRSLLGISWREKRTNASVIQEIGQLRGDLTLQQRAIRQKLMYFGHVMRAEGMEKMMLACGEGRRSRGRPRTRWMDEIHRRTAMSLAQLRDAVRSREDWRKLVTTVARVPRTDGTR